MPVCLTDRNVMRQVNLSAVVIIVLCSNDVRSPSLLQPNYLHCLYKLNAIAPQTYTHAKEKCVWKFHL